MTLRKIIILTLVACSLNCFGWGQKGHDVTCAIAQKHLTDKAKERINDLLDGKSIVYWANWLDNAVYTPRYTYARTWHYKNVDANQKYEEVKDFETGDVVSALTDIESRMRKYETNREKYREEEVLALKMIIHLMGDLHQPMHLGHSTDRGGNNWMVNYFERLEINLHTMWDTNIVQSAHAWSHTEWVEEIDRATEEEEEAIVQGNYHDWARQTHEICSRIYAETPQNSNISYDYVAQWTPVIEQQFLRGGLRLAKVLNDIFR